MINKSNRLLICFYVVVGMIFFAAVFSSCENDLAVIRDMQKSKLSVDEANGIVSYFSMSGKVRARLTAPQLFRYYDSVPRIEFEKSLHVDFFNDVLQSESYLDARKGYYYEQQGKVTLRDSVVVIRKEGDTLRTNELYWDQQQHRLYTHADVEIRQKTKTIFGKGFESDEQLRNFRIDTVRGVLMVEKSKLGE